MAKEIKFNVKLVVDGKEQLVTATSVAEELRRAFDSAGASGQKLNVALANFNQAITVANNVTNAISQISGALNGVTEESRSFSAAMNAANTMAGKSGEDFAKLKGQVTELSKTIPVVRDELANGLYQVISNGVPEDNWITFLQKSAKASVGGIADLGETVKVTSTIIKNYGLSWDNAGDVQDKIQLAAKSGVTSFEQLAQALPRVTSNAATLGVSVDELMATFATLTGVSGNTAEVSTQLAAIFTALVKPSQEASKMARQMGIEFDAAADGKAADDNANNPNAPTPTEGDVSAEQPQEQDPQPGMTVRAVVDGTEQDVTISEVDGNGNYTGYYTNEEGFDVPMTINAKDIVRHPKPDNPDNPAPPPVPDAPTTAAGQTSDEVRPLADDTVGGSPVALSYLLEGGRGAILNAGYFLHGVAAAFPRATETIERIRTSHKNKLGLNPMEFVQNHPKVLADIETVVRETYGDKGVDIYKKLCQNASGFYPREGVEVGREIDALEITGGMSKEGEKGKRSLSRQQIDALLKSMSDNAETLVEKELTPQTWAETFDEYNRISTPLGVVKMGDNQLTKFFEKNRTKEFGMVAPTLKDPDIIVAEHSQAKDGKTERDSSYLFIKTFKRENGEEIKFYASVTVKRDGMEVSISSHYMNKNKVKGVMSNGEVLHIRKALLPNSSDMRLAEHQNNVPDLLPTQGSNVSEGKDNSSEGEKQGPESEKVSSLSKIPLNDRGEPDFEQADADTAWDALVEQTDGDTDMAQRVADGMLADMERQLKTIEKAKVKGGATVARKIAAEIERKAAIEEVKAEVEGWRRIADTQRRRRAAEIAEREAKAEKARAEQKARMEAERKAKEEAERKEREELNGVPDVVDDKASDARARGYRRVSGHKVERQEELSGIRGKKVSVRFSDDVMADGKIAVIEASELQPSHSGGERNPRHFIDEAQPKERKDDVSRMSSRRIAENMRPEEITSSVAAYTGAPTVNQRGEVIQGNNRSDALRQMWSEHKNKAEEYKRYLMDHADDFGLDVEAIGQMNNPVLVNMLDVEDAEAIKLGQYVAQDTESGGTERIKGKNIVNKIGDDIRTFANMLLSSSDEDMTFAELLDKNGMDVLKWLNRKGHITPTQYKSAFDGKGNLTSEVKNDLRGIMYQSIFKGGGARFEEMFNLLPAKAQKAILATAYRDYDSPTSERMIEEIQNSIRTFYALSQNADFVNAKSYKEARASVEAWERQYQLDDVTGESYLPSENFSNFALLLATMYKGESQRVIQDSFNRTFDLIQGTQQADLFNEPDNTPRALVQAIKEVFKIDYNGRQRKSVNAISDMVGNGNSERGQGGDGVASSGGRVQNGERSAEPLQGDAPDSGETKTERNIQEPLRGSDEVYAGERIGSAEQQAGNGVDGLRNNDRRGTEVRADARQGDLARAGEIDENGYPFVVSSDGTTIFGEITDDTGLPSAPIKLSRGVVDENGNGYGLRHIEVRHGEQIKNAGFGSVVDFVKYVAENYDKDNIKVGKKRVNGSGTFVIQIEDEHSNLLYIELSRDGSYWNVNSGGVFRKGYSKKRKNVESNTELSTSDTASSDKSFVQTDSVDGSKSADTHSDNQRFSDDKDTPSAETSQTNEQEKEKKGNQPDKKPPLREHKAEGAKPIDNVEKRLRDALVGLLRKTGLKVSMDSEAARRALDEANGKDVQVRMQAMINGLNKASNFILSVLKGQTKQRKAKIEIPEIANRLAEKTLKHPIKSHSISANEIVHIKKRHGENGTANNSNSIPLRDEDISLMPYIMAAPTRVIKGSTAVNGTESVRYEKELVNGYVVVVEREGRFDVEDMENITMWAQKSQPLMLRLPQGPRIARPKRLSLVKLTSQRY